MFRGLKLTGLIFLIWLAGGCFACAQACDKGIAPSRCAQPRLPHEVTRLIPPGFEVLDYLGGNLTDDGRTDYLVVVHHHEDSEQNPSPRPLLIFTARPDGTFKLSARNDAVIMRAGDGGGSSNPFSDPYDVENDYFDGLAIKNRYFTIQQSMAAGINHWTDYITFHYDPQRRDWLFDSEIYTNYQASLFSDRPPVVKTTRANRKHPVSFVNWLPDYWCDADAGHEKDEACQHRQARVGG